MNFTMVFAHKTGDSYPSRAHDPVLFQVCPVNLDYALLISHTGYYTLDYLLYICEPKEQLHFHGINKIQHIALITDSTAGHLYRLRKDCSQVDNTYVLFIILTRISFIKHLKLRFPQVMLSSDRSVLTRGAS